MRRIGSSLGSLFGGSGKVEKAASGGGPAASVAVEEEPRATSVKERIAQLQQHAALGGSGKKVVLVERSVSCDFDEALGSFDGWVPCDYVEVD